VLLLSRSEAYAVRELVIVAPLTSRIRRIPTEVAPGRAHGLPRRRVVNRDTITTIPERVLTQRLTALPTGKPAAVDRALRFAPGLV
jgi:mRNA interferase MazF